MCWCILYLESKKARWRHQPQNNWTLLHWEMWKTIYLFYRLNQRRIGLSLFSRWLNRMETYSQMYIVIVIGSDNNTFETDILTEIFMSKTIFTKSNSILSAFNSTEWRFSSGSCFVVAGLLKLPFYSYKKWNYRWAKILANWVMMSIWSWQQVGA